MKVLILGAEGMLGHKMYQVLSQHFDAYVILRKPAYDWKVQSEYLREMFRQP